MRRVSLHEHQPTQEDLTNATVYCAKCNHEFIGDLTNPEPLICPACGKPADLELTVEQHAEIWALIHQILGRGTLN